MTIVPKSELDAAMTNPEINLWGEGIAWEDEKGEEGGTRPPPVPGPRRRTAVVDIAPNTTSTAGAPLLAAECIRGSVPVITIVNRPDEAELVLPGVTMSEGDIETFTAPTSPNPRSLHVEQPRFLAGANGAKLELIYVETER